MSAPKHLSPAQAEIYQDTIAMLGESIPKRATLNTLEAYAIQRARWIAAEKYLEENGDTMIIRSDKGIVMKVVEAPQLRIAQNAQESALKLARMLRI